MLCIWKFDLNKYQENVNISSIGSGQYLYRDNVKKKKDKSKICVLKKHKFINISLPRFILRQLTIVD